MVDLSMSPGGDYFLTCGNDASVKTVNMKDSSSTSLLSIDYEINTIAVDGDSFFIGLDDGMVQEYTIAGEFKSNVYRGTLAIKHVAFSKEHMCVSLLAYLYFVHYSPYFLASAVASEENVVKLVSRADITQITDLVGHSEQVKSVDFSPDGKFVASASCDGSVKVWNVANGDEFVASWPCLPKDDGDSKMLCRARFNSTGKLLALPGKHNIDIIDTATCKTAYTLLHGHADKLVTVTSWSPDGKFLATADMNNQVHSYDL
jgi:chromosome transmission fidelity protein 4